MPERSRPAWHLDGDGSAAVELALVLPILVLLIIGALDFASLFNTSQAIAAATRVGAEYARSSTTCQSGIDVLNNPQISGTCITGIENAMQASYNFNPSITFPNGVSLTCYCDGDGGTIACGNASCATAGRGNNELFAKVTVLQAFTPIIPLPGLPTSLSGLTELRLQ